MGRLSVSVTCTDCRCSVTPNSLPVVPVVERRGLLALVVDAPSGAEALGRTPWLGAQGELMAATIRGVARFVGQEDFTIEAEVAVFYAVARPVPGNKPPKIADVRACRDRLLAELDAARPRMVLSAGASACASLSGAAEATPITKWRGQMRWLDLASGPVPWVATISPGSVVARADLYRDLSQDVWKAWTQPEPLPEAIVNKLETLEGYQ